MSPAVQPPNRGQQSRDTPFNVPISARVAFDSGICYHFFRPARGGFREISVKAKDFEKLLAKNAPPAARIRGGFPTYHFIGGHNDLETVPVAALIASSERALARSGRALATYNLDSGPQG